MSGGSEDSVGGSERAVMGYCIVVGGELVLAADVSFCGEVAIIIEDIYVQGFGAALA